jgi:hypothetical protein
MGSFRGSSVLEPVLAPAFDWNVVAGGLDSVWWRAPVLSVVLKSFIFRGEFRRRGCSGRVCCRQRIRLLVNHPSLRCSCVADAG